MHNSDPLVIEIGELAAIKLATSQFRSASSTLVGPGDDAAVVGLSTPRVVITTDTMIQGHDFRLDTSSAFDLGFKAVASNIADVAAMGAKPIALVVSMAITRETRVSWLMEFARGLQVGIDQLAPDAAVVGGDLATAEQVVISVTAHGDLFGSDLILRSGASPGDQIAVCGTLGKAAAGLELLEHPDESLAKSYSELTDIQLRPIPPLATLFQGLDGITAMLDISDGLSLDARRLADASGVQLAIESSKLLGFAAVLEQAADSLQSRDGKQRDPMDWVLHGGEDHSFLVTLAPGVSHRGFKVIGSVQQGSGVLLDGKELAPSDWDSVSG